MIPAAIDTTSQSYASGQVVGTLSVAVVAIVLLWRTTRDWRAPSTPPGGDHSDTLREAAKRHRLIVGVTTLIAVIALVQAVYGYHPEPRAAEAMPEPTVEETPVPGAPRAALPGSFADFRLMTGTAAEQAKAAWLGGRTLPEGQWLGFYDRDADGSADLVLTLRTTEANPGLKAEKARMSVSQEFTNLFAGAKAHDVTSFDAGPYGGGLSCGLVSDPTGDRTLCAWSDATTLAAATLRAPTPLPDAAKTTLAARTAAMS